MLRSLVGRHPSRAIRGSLAFVVIALIVTASSQRWLGGIARAAGVVNFIATDDVGPWFQCVGAGCVPAGTESLAVVQPGTDVRITVGNESNTVHTWARTSRWSTASPCPPAATWPRGCSARSGWSPARATTRTTTR